MGKTNMERVQKVTRKWFEIIGKHKWLCPQWMQDILEGMVLVLVSKAEKRGRRKEKEWWRERWIKRNKDIIEHIEQQCKPAPQFDAEKVRYLIELYGHNSWQEGRQFGPNDNSVMSCDDFHNRAEYYGRRLLAALHLK